jgi:hypothetical protein
MFSIKVRFYFLLSLLFGVFILFIQARLSEDEKHREEFETFYRIYSLSIPDDLFFAGEKVPLSDFDVKERYDKELLTNVYWQSQSLLMMKRAEKYFPIIEKVLKQNDIPLDFKYIALAESGLQPHVVSPAGAASWWQFLDKTGKVFGLEINEEVDERYHLEKSTEAACKYFKQAYKEFGSWALVAASYNMGIEGVKKQLQQQGVNNYYDLYLNTETSRYVLRVLAIKEILEHKQQYGFNVVKNHLYTQVPTIKIKISKPIDDFAKFALEQNCNYKQVKLLNPWLRKNTLSNKEGKTYIIELPKERLLSSSRSESIVGDTLDLN